MALLHLVLVFIMVAGPSLAAIQNRTIDDTRGDSVTANPVIYQGLWNSHTCPQCSIQPDPAQAFDGTWTEATYFQQSQDPINATLTFTGTAIYVFFILANNEGTGIISNTKANITLDNQPPLPFEHIPDISSSDLQYNALVFSQDNLENIHHSLVISVSGIREEVYVNFDYAIYTHEDIIVEATGEPAVGPVNQPPTPTSSQPEAPLTSQESSSSIASPSSKASNALPPSQHAKASISVGAVAGIAVGGLVILSLLVFSIVFIWNRVRERRRDSKRSSANLLGSEDGNSESRNYTGHGNIDENGIDTSFVPYPLGPPYPEQPAGIKPSEIAAMSTDGGMPSVTLGQNTHNSNENEVAHANSRRRTADLRRVRQEELDQRLQAVQQEMIEVLNEINNRRTSQQTLRPLPMPGQQSRSLGARNHGNESTDGQMSVLELQETHRHVRRQIERLQQQQRSAWTQGLSNDSPPGYSTNTRLS